MKVRWDIWSLCSQSNSQPSGGDRDLDQHSVVRASGESGCPKEATLSLGGPVDIRRVNGEQVEERLARQRRWYTGRWATTGVSLATPSPSHSGQNRDGLQITPTSPSLFKKCKQSPSG